MLGEEVADFRYDGYVLAPYRVRAKRGEQIRPQYRPSHICAEISGQHAT